MKEQPLGGTETESVGGVWTSCHPLHSGLEPRDRSGPIASLLVKDLTLAVGQFKIHD